MKPEIAAMVAEVTAKNPGIKPNSATRAANVIVRRRLTPDAVLTMDAETIMRLDQVGKRTAEVILAWAGKEIGDEYFAADRKLLGGMRTEDILRELGRRGYAAVRVKEDGPSLPRYEA